MGDSVGDRAAYDDVPPRTRSAGRAPRRCVARSARRRSSSPRTARLAAVSTLRRVRRATSRTPSSIGTGSRAENAISHGRRRGGCAGSFSALIVLVCGRRGSAGMIVAPAATATATERHHRRPTRRSASGDGRLRAVRCPDSVSSGASQLPDRRPRPPRPRARGAKVLGEQHHRHQRGVPPTALSSPTRRVCSAIRPPTTTAMLAIASIASSELTISSTF